MKKLISFTFFVFILLMMVALKAAQAQRVVVRPLVVAPRFVARAGIYPRYRRARVVMPPPIFRPVVVVPRPKFYPRPMLSARVHW